MSVKEHEDRDEREFLRTQFMSKELCSSEMGAFRNLVNEKFKGLRREIAIGFSVGTAVIVFVQFGLQLLLRQ